MRTRSEIAETMRSGSYSRLSAADFEGLVDGIYNHYGRIEHDLYKTGEAAPDEILDRNGEVVLTLCKKCGLGESELIQPCTPEHHATYEMLVHSPLMLRKR